MDSTAAIFTYHRDLITLHGSDSSYVLGWRDWESQQTRFEVLSRVASLDGRTVLDAGCGHGDLLPFLQERYPELSNYYGIEQIPELIEVARNRYKGYSGVTFLSGDFMNGKLPLVDYVFASGSLNYANINPVFIFKAITRLFQSSRMGFAFNLLHKAPVTEMLVAYNIEHIMTHCRSLTKRTVLITDYSDEDFTVYLYK